MKRISILVPIESYNISDDKRLLIPFLENGKLGLMDKEGSIIVPARYDSILDDCYDSNGLIRIGIRTYQAYERKTTAPVVYEYIHYGVYNLSKGWIIEPKYREVFISTDGRILTLRKDTYYCVQDLEGNVIVDYHKYSFIDGFVRDLSRVSNGEKWGIINEKGELVPPLVFDQIWNFHGYDGKTIKCFVGKGDSAKEYDISVSDIKSEAIIKRYNHWQENAPQTYDSVDVFLKDNI